MLRPSPQFCATSSSSLVASSSRTGILSFSKPQNRIVSNRVYSKLSGYSDRAEKEPEIITDRRGAIQAAVTLPAVFTGLVLTKPSRADDLPSEKLPPGVSPLPEETVTLIFPADVANLSASEKQIYNQNQRIQSQNRVPKDFPGFIRKGFDIKVVAEGYQASPSGLIYKDFLVGTGKPPVEGQEVVFHYTGYNESGTTIDSSYRKGRPAETQVGIAGLIPGFEEALRGMSVGQQRRIIIPPALGPPVGPSTFFSAKQCEVFDVELLDIKNCRRRQLAMFSDVVCE